MTDFKSWADEMDEYDKLAQKRNAIKDQYCTAGEVKGNTIISYNKPKRFLEKNIDPLISLLSLIPEYFDSITTIESANESILKNLITTDGSVGIGYPKMASFRACTMYSLTRRIGIYPIVGVVTLSGLVLSGYPHSEIRMNQDYVAVLSILPYKKNKNPRPWYQKRYDYSDEAYLLTKDIDNLAKSIGEPSSIIKKFYLLRHNLFHVICCWKYGLKLRLNPQDDYVDLRDIGSIQSPDILEFDNKHKHGLIGDVQITTDVSRGYYRKVEKYSKLTKLFLNKGISMSGFYVVCKPDLSNFEYSMSRLQLKPITLVSHNVYWESVNQCYESLRTQHGSKPFESFYKTMESEETKYKFNKLSIDDKWCDQSLSNSISIGSIKEEVKNYIERKHCKHHDKVYDTKENDEIFNEIDDENKKYVRKFKPSLHMLIPPDTIGITESNDNLEQEQIRDFCYTYQSVDIPEASQILTQLGNVLKDEKQFRFFKNGVTVENEDKLRTLYHEYRSERKEKKSRGQPVSFESFCEQNGVKRDRNGTMDRVEKRKVCRLHLKNEGLTFLQKSGIDHLKKNQYIRVYKERHSADLAMSSKSVNDFLTFLTNKFDGYHDKQLIEELDKVGVDSKFFTRLKTKMLSEGKEAVHELSKFYAYKFLRHSSLAYEQLIHMGNNSCRANNMSFFTTGIPNMMVILTGGYRGFNQSSGKSFCYMGFTRIRESLDKRIFGKIKTVKHGDGYFYMSGWRRLEGHRLEFMRDSHLSVLSSTINTLLRIPKVDRYTDENVKGTLSLRTMVSLCPNTGFITKIADCRYAILSALSTHTNFPAFIREKLKPPYNNSIEAWCIHRMWKRLPKFRSDATRMGALEFRTAKFDVMRMRSNTSIGGRLNFRGIWTGRPLTTIQDLLDEVYLYVHTPKEPVNEYHEEVSALRTIKKYEDLYRIMPEHRKRGTIKNRSELVDFLDSSSPVGFCSVFLDHATKYRTRDLDIDMEKICTHIATENIGKIQSTKAVIPETKRDVVAGSSTLTKAMMLRRKFIESNKIPTVSEYIKASRHYKEEKVPLYHGRMKVHDALLPFMNDGCETVVGAAYKHMNESGRVLADICIKAQYGAKREFYVLNIGAKIIARVVENFFKKLCQKSSTEMISVPGDDKFLHMQRMLDRQTMKAMKSGSSIKYINGDCTKWSAAETLEAFQIMLHSMKDIFDEGLYTFIFKVFDAWRNKKIQIPARIVNRVLPSDSKTTYLLDASKDNYQLKSTQNFLQGVFNYTSSYKADCVAYTTIAWYKEFYPNSDLIAEYLVHSDDYVWVIVTKSPECFMNFRTLSKSLMKLGGITDSVKKTNCQYIFMEFISLIGFNGSMCYPQIKKVKEVTSTLPCESFVGDSAAVCGRTSECLRVGTPHTSSYIFHRLHMYQFMRSYGCHKNGYNSVENRLDTPVSFFGQSDMHPLFYLMSTGDPNNYRIKKYGDIQLIRKLYSATIKYGKTGEPDEFLNPTFLYNRYTNRVKQLRKSTGLTPDEALGFFEKYPVYSFTKPQRVDRLHTWSLSMYYRNSFIKAYNRDSRTIRMLRLSMFTKGKCLTTKNFLELVEFYKNLPYSKSTKIEYWKKHTLTIREYQSLLANHVVTEEIDDQMLEIFCLQGYSQVSTMYSWSSSVKLLRTERRFYHSTVATKVPQSPNWLDVSSPINMLLLYIMNREEFMREFPGTDRLPILEQDCQILRHNFGNIMTRAEKSDRLACCAIHTILDSIRSPRMIVMASSRHNSTITSFLGNHFKRFSNPTYYTNIIGSRFVQAKNPYTLSSEYIDQRSRSSSVENMIANKLGLCISYIVGRTDKDISVLNDSTIMLSDGEQTTLRDWAIESTSSTLQQSGVSRLGMLAVGFYQSFLGSNVILNNMISTGNSFLYTLDSKDENRIGSKYSGILKVYIQYQNTISCTTYHHETKQWNCCVQTKFGTHAAYHMYYGLIMAGVIPKRYIDIPIMNYNWAGLGRKLAGEHLTLLGCVWKFTESMEGIGLPCYQSSTLETRLPRQYKRPTISSYKISLNGLSIYRGTLKHFTLKYDLYKDSACFKVDSKGDEILNVMNSYSFKDFMLPNTVYSNLESSCKPDTKVETRVMNPFLDWKNELDSAVMNFTLIEGHLNDDLHEDIGDPGEVMQPVDENTLMVSNFDIVERDPGVSWRLRALKSMGSITDDISLTLFKVDPESLNAGHIYYLYLLNDVIPDGTFAKLAISIVLNRVYSKLININGHLVKYAPGTGPVLYEFMRVESRIIKDNYERLVDVGFLGSDKKILDTIVDGHNTIYKPVKGSDKLTKWVLQKYAGFFKNSKFENAAKDKVYSNCSVNLFGN